MKVTWIPVLHVWVRKKNPVERLDSHRARRMNKDVKINGIVNPITVMQMGSRYLLIDGRYRLRAAKKNGMERIPAYVQPRMTPEQMKQKQKDNRLTEVVADGFYLNPTN